MSIRSLSRRAEFVRSPAMLPVRSINPQLLSKRNWCYLYRSIKVFVKARKPKCSKQVKKSSRRPNQNVLLRTSFTMHGRSYCLRRDDALVSQVQPDGTCWKWVKLDRRIKHYAGGRWNLAPKKNVGVNISINDSTKWCNHGKLFRGGGPTIIADLPASWRHLGYN